METYFIKSNGKLARKQNTLIFISEDKKKKYLPIKEIREILIFGNVSLTSGAIKLLLANNVFVHIFSSKGFYLGSIIPKRYEGDILISQVKAYLDYGERLYIAKSIIDATKRNFYEIFRRYKNLENELEKLREISILSANSINEVMGIESQIFLLAYRMFDNVSKLKIVERKRNPPGNEANALLSFLNSILYGLTLTEIYKQGLNPSVSYLHEPREKRPSLALDLAEIFKPIFSFRLMLYLINKEILKKNIHFYKSLEGYYLNDAGKEIVLEYVSKYLEKVITVKNIGKRKFRTAISYVVKQLKNYLMGRKNSFSPYIY